VRFFAAFTVSTCHGERSPNAPAKRASEGKSNHPENASFAKPRQGVLPGILPVGEPWVGLKGEQSAVEPERSRRRGTGIFVRAPLLFVPTSQNRTCWEQLRASLRRKEG
jgi:hypothetical protein